MSKVRNCGCKDCKTQKGVGRFEVKESILFEAEVLSPESVSGVQDIMYQGPRKNAEWVADALNYQHQVKPYPNA